MNPFLLDKSIIATIPDQSPEDLKKIAAAYRINCLAGLFAARHGWLGASFSCIDLLTCIYHRFIKDPLLPIENRGSLILSKGHAAMAHYAVLAGRGCFAAEKLLAYKALGGLPAHSDRSVPGVDSDSGSLGQGLSKAIGIALSNRALGLEVPVFTIIGDGELQEGQLFEAFLSLKKLNLSNCIAIIDRNHLQSDSQTADIKDAQDWARVFTHIGLNCMSIDGHDFAQIENAVNQSLRINAPMVIIAETIKGGGCSLTAMKKDTPRRQGIWHGQIPDDRQYIAAVKELVRHTGNQQVMDAFKDYLGTLASEKNFSEPAPVAKPGTGPAFSAALTTMARRFAHLYVLDADLEKSCRLSEFAQKFPERFIEVGISEQDMCSIATGLALTGKVAVVNTYASFYKRSLDQIYNAVTEKVPVIFAGHYAGADYYSDGKSHQSVNDIGLMRSLGEIEVLEPLNAKQCEEMLEYLINRLTLEWAQKRRATPAYIRLHRSEPENLPQIEAGFVPGDPVIFQKDKSMSNANLLFVCGPHMLVEACGAADMLEKKGISLNVAAISLFADPNKVLKKMIEEAGKIFTLEDHRRETGLGGFIANIGFRNPVRIGIRSYRQSTLTASEMFSVHQITADDVCAVVEKVVSCSHNKT